MNAGDTVNTGTDPDQRRIEIAKVGRPHGVAGEVRVFPLNAETEALFVGARVFWTGNRTERELRIEAIRPGNSALLVRFTDIAGRDIAGRDDAGLLKGGMLAVLRSSLPELDDDEVYLDDLVGMTVLDAVTGERLGSVDKIGRTNIDVLDIKLDRGGGVLVPYIAQYVGDLDKKARTIAVTDIDHWL